MSLVMVTTAGLTFAATATMTAFGSGPAARAEAPGLAETDGALAEGVTEPEVEAAGKPEAPGVVDADAASVGLAAPEPSARPAGVAVPASADAAAVAAAVAAPAGPTIGTSPIVTTDATAAVTSE